VGSATVAVKSSHVDDPQSVGLNVIESVVESTVAFSLDTSHRYQKVARDDVRVHFEKEGTDMMFMQCSIGDETLREELRNKLEKGRE
jgi:hypothetical protein